jgi:short-subunit dehydrogenase
MKMSNKVVLVTGASSGFGELTVEKLLSKGYTVYAAARRVERMKKLEEKGAKLLAMDVTSDEQVAAGIDTIIKNEGSIYGLVNNAGYGGYGMIESVDLAEAERQFQVNVFGLARVTKAVLPHMRASKEGRIVNLASVAGQVAFAMGGWYTASKHAVEALSDALRNEVKDFGIKVSIVEPSAVKTEFLDRAMENVDAVNHDPAYKSKVEGFKKNFSESYANAPGPEDAAKAIFDGIDSKNPKIRYQVSGAKMAITMKNLLPAKAFDNIMNNMMGMN